MKHFSLTLLVVALGSMAPALGFAKASTRPADAAELCTKIQPSPDVQLIGTPRWVEGGDAPRTLRSTWHQSKQSRISHAPAHSMEWSLHDGRMRWLLR